MALTDSGAEVYEAVRSPAGPPLLLRLLLLRRLPLERALAPRMFESA
jgi:hypothetical protein